MAHLCRVVEVHHSPVEGQAVLEDHNLFCHNHLDRPTVHASLTLCAGLQYMLFNQQQVLLVHLDR